jgi:hypothetical protein
VGFEPIRSAEKVEPKLTSISDKISDCFTQYMNAISYFRKSGNKTKARETYTRAKTLFDFANQNGIELNDEDTTYYSQTLEPTYQK